MWEGKILEQDLSICACMPYKHHVFISSTVTLQQQTLRTNRAVPHNADRITVQPWVSQQRVKWQRRDDCRPGMGCVRFCDDVDNGRGKRQKVNKKGMSKILNFQVYLSVLVLAAPLSLKHLTTKLTRFLQQGRIAGGCTPIPVGQHAKTGGDKFLQLHLVHVPPPQAAEKTMWDPEVKVWCPHTSSKWNWNTFMWRAALVDIAGSVFLSGKDKFLCSHLVKSSLCLAWTLKGNLASRVSFPRCFLKRYLIYF